MFVMCGAAVWQKIVARLDDTTLPVPEMHLDGRYERRAAFAAGKPTAC
jgi:hypothetical protein